MNPWTMPDVAARLGVAHETVRSWLHRGQLPAPSGRVGQSPWWAPEVIEPWMRQWEADHEPYEGSFQRILPSTGASGPVNVRRWAAAAVLPLVLLTGACGPADPMADYHDKAASSGLSASEADKLATLLCDVTTPEQAADVLGRVSSDSASVIMTVGDDALMAHCPERYSVWFDAPAT